MRIALGLILTLFLAREAVAEDMRATVLEVHDGDTLFFRPDGDCLPKLFQRMGLRFLGCDTPELRDKRPEIREQAHAALAYTAERIKPGQVVVIKNVKWDKFGGRVDGTIEVDGVNLCTLLIDAGLARPFNGQGSKPW